MIPVKPAPEPGSFDANVRQPGLSAIAELTGNPPLKPRPGPRRAALSDSPGSIPSHKFPPLWREALVDLRESYGNLCAYLGLYIHHATGAATVDHFVSRNRDWRLVYEWSNYRLASSLINGYRSDRVADLDPFSIDDGLFGLELTEFQVVPGPSAVPAMLDKVARTIEVLGLNQRECRKARQAYAEDYWLGPPLGIGLPRLERHAPLVARELRRQGQLARGDA